MKKVLSILIFIIWFVVLMILSGRVFAQCDPGPACGAGMVNVEITITTDIYGSETSWVLYDLTNSTGCGISPYAGGCAAGVSTLSSSNTSTWNLCYPVGASMEFSIGDDYGDGGADYEVKVCDVVVANGSGNWGCLKTHNFTIPTGGCASYAGVSCSNPFVLSELTFDSIGMTTNGFSDNYNDFDACGSTYLNGDDYVFSLTPTVDTCINIRLSNASSYAGLFLFDGCPDVLSTSCIAQSIGSNAEISMTSITRNKEYFIVVSTAPSPQYTDFDISIYPECMPDKPSCSTNNQAGDLCSSSTFISNLNGYCGNTSGDYLADTPGDLTSNFCGSIENNSWLSFVADSSIAKFYVFVENCLNSQGIQITVYDTDCNTFIPVSNCWNPGYQVNGVVTATNLTVGNTYYIMIDGYNGDVCDYTIGAKEGSIKVLPLDFLDARASPLSTGANLVEWKTAAESDMILYQVERKNIQDGKFYAIGTIEPKNEQGMNMYSFSDDEGSSGWNYYRVMYKDFLGLQAYSKTLAVYQEHNQTISSLLYPNPVTSRLTVSIDSEDFSEATIQILSSNGTIRYVRNLSLKAGRNLQEFNVENFEKGVYLVRIKTETKLLFDKFVK